MSLQIVANAFVVVVLAVVLVQCVMLGWSFLEGDAELLPEGWSPQSRLHFYRARFVLRIIGPVAWVLSLLVAVRQGLGWSGGLLDTRAALDLAVLAGYVGVWLFAIRPGDYRNQNPLPIIWVALMMSGVTFIRSGMEYFSP